MTRNKPFFLFLFAIFLGLPKYGLSQDVAGYSKQELKDLSSKVEDQIRFLEYFLNTLGSQDTPARDKDVIIRESYKKIFRDEKVQVEDDLLLDRKVITNKDITAYMKDIEFFFKDANFKFKVREIKPFARDNGELSFLVSMDRTLTALGLNKEKISNTKPRFVEVNVDKRSNELKIASIYTTKLSRDKELLEWWKNLSYTWESYFRKKIGLSESDSVSLDDLYKISSIDSINLSGNSFVKDLEAIDALRELKYIDISNTNIQELNPISNVTFLTYLNIANTPTQDIQFIKYSDRLSHLNISGTQIRDISELGNLKQLQILEVAGTPVASFGVLNSFESLRNLNLSKSGFNNVENIVELENLTHLDISGNYLINLEMLSELKNLEHLNLQETNMVDLSPLSGLAQLKMVNINQTEIADLSPLNDKFTLQRVYADRTRISESNADEFTRRNRRVLLIHNVENLQTWWNGLSEGWKETLISINPSLAKAIPTVEDLSTTVALDSLNLSGSRITNLGPVLKFRKISYLNFDNTEIQDLSPLSDMKTLISISGKNSQVKNLSPLSNLSGLTHLDFENAPVENFLPLKELPELVYLNIDRSKIDQEETPEFLLANPNINIIYRSDALSMWWELLTDSWRTLIIDQFERGNSQPGSEALHRWTASPELKIGRSSISNLQPILIFNNLRRLEVHDVPLMDIQVLGGMELLEELKISNAPVSEISALSFLRNLRILDLSNTGIEDLRPLSSLRELRELNVSGTNIKVLRGLESLSNLQELDIANTNVRSLRPVQGLISIEKLICFNTKLNKRAVDTYRKLNPNADVRFY
ncbi:leucine-rich repeat domain-containing protein [Cecembia rubra]|uniref:Leucine-rich repeat (LRR) protein n=1 Tax=Cecembia rubra TaxID=1485585 RepID=A0A2P8EEW8_9BACT|nr:leucine-rich repeat domain-containing protein [Cecembia rubra]PSL08016.1 Leucine-rich repeat (LRR) protein [Cecembia rubra]